MKVPIFNRRAIHLMVAVFSALNRKASPHLTIGVFPLFEVKIMARALKLFLGEIAFSGFLLGNRQNFGVAETCDFSSSGDKMAE